MLIHQHLQLAKKLNDSNPVAAIFHRHSVDENAADNTRGNARIDLTTPHAEAIQRVGVWTSERFNQTEVKGDSTRLARKREERKVLPKSFMTSKKQPKKPDRDSKMWSCFGCCGPIGYLRSERLYACILL